MTTSPAKPDVSGFFDDATNTISYVVADPATKACAIVDPVLDFDHASGRTSTVSVDKLLEFIRTRELSLELVLETHVHADHLTGSAAINAAMPSRLAIGSRISTVQEVFRDIFNLDDVTPDGSQFDLLLDDGDEFDIGQLRGRVIHTPGHTPACNTYVIGDAAFVGDTLFMPDYGTARCDFPGGDAGTLYDSIQKIFNLPGDTRLFMCHDYKAPGRDEYAWETTVDEQKLANVHLRDGVERDDYVRFRNERDAQLSMPKLILPSLQVNIRAGELPPPESNGVRYMKLPLDAL